MCVCDLDGTFLFQSYEYHVINYELIMNSM